MARIYTAKIQERDGVETYTAQIQKNGAGWIGRIREIPKVNCEKRTKKELLDTLEIEFHKILEANADAWDKQFEEDVKTGRLDHLGKKAREDFRAGRCTESIKRPQKYFQGRIERIRERIREKLREREITEDSDNPKL